MGSFIKGACIGLLTGASIGLMVSPKSRRKLMRSTPVKTVRAARDMLDNVIH